MFTWICPKCGTEVPPSYSDCPNCAKPAAAPAPPAATATATRPMPLPLPVTETVAVASAPAPAPAAPAPAPVRTGHFQTSAEPAPAPTLSVPSAYASGPEAKGGMPGWLAAILSLVLVGGLSYLAIGFFTKPAGNSAAEAAVAAEANAPKQQALEAHPLNKFIEVTGLRVTEEGNRGTLKFLVVNHSSGPVGGVNLEIEVRAAGAKPEDPPLITVKAPLKNVGPLESRDFSVPMTSTAKSYEMPDWQFLRASYRITE